MPAPYGLNKKKYPPRFPRCRQCNRKFETQNPTKIFCKERCRVAYWRSKQRIGGIE